MPPAHQPRPCSFAVFACALLLPLAAGTTTRRRRYNSCTTCSSTLSSRAGFPLAAEGTNTCSGSGGVAITSLARCERAAKSWGDYSVTVENEANSPKGCYLLGDGSEDCYGLAYYNTHSTGGNAAWISDYPVCYNAALDSSMSECPATSTDTSWLWYLLGGIALALLIGVPACIFGGCCSHCVVVFAAAAPVQPFPFPCYFLRVILLST